MKTWPSLSNRPTISSSSTLTSVLPADVIDSFATLIALSGNPVARASVAVGLLEEVYATVAALVDQAERAAWTAELTSLDQVVQEIRAHRDRMAAGSGRCAGWIQQG